MAELREIVSGLRFPEGPIAMDDGSVVLVEIARGTLSRVDVEKGTIDVIAECGRRPGRCRLRVQQRRLLRVARRDGDDLPRSATTHVSRPRLDPASRARNG